MNNESLDNTPIAPPPEHAEPAKAADELLSHGLLTFLHQDPPAETDRRMRAVMRRISDESPLHAPGRNARFVFPHARRWVALAACFVIAASLVYLGLPAGSTAQAMVQASAATLREPGERRFEIRVQPRGTKQLSESPIGTLDTSGGELMVMRMQPEEGVWVTFGRDPRGAWLVHPDGHMERNPQGAAVPRLGMVGEQPVLPESLDRVLDELAYSYTLVQTSEKTGDGAATIEHIVGTRRADRAPGVPRIEVWIDTKSKSLKKVAMFFPEPPRGMGPGRGPGGPGGQGGPGADGPDGPDGPRGDRRRPMLDGPRDEDRGGPLPPPPLDGGRGPGRRDGRGPEDGGERGPEGRGPRGNPLMVEFRPVPPPPFAPGWFTPEHHAKRPPAPRP